MRILLEREGDYSKGSDLVVVRFAVLTRRGWAICVVRPWIGRVDCVGVEPGRDVSYCSCVGRGRLDIGCGCHSAGGVLGLVAILLGFLHLCRGWVYHSFPFVQDLGMGVFSYVLVSHRVELRGWI